MRGTEHAAKAPPARREDSRAQAERRARDSPVTWAGTLGPPFCKATGRGERAPVPTATRGFSERISKFLALAPAQLLNPPS
ncbi:hypothetical protein GW7_21796 [Heterocephalus glaber]|uniref:Uncharacterized protein n=1 Tax=Heterocephalus glaber TaxID=10181 RepID=G5C4L1_HETGA|nr:hypothetical protein GW7_21796 [Heterocephalus glaber]